MQWSFTLGVCLLALLILMVIVTCLCLAETLTRRRSALPLAINITGAMGGVALIAAARALDAQHDTFGWALLTLPLLAAFSLAVIVCGLADGIGRGSATINA